MRRLLVLIAVSAAVAVAAGLAAVDPLPGDVAEGGRAVVDRAKDRGREAVRTRRPRVRASRCPKRLAGCRAVRGRVVFVERVDPDGDGDLHVVVADGGITAPGLTSVDVRPGLRPRRDPRVGDQASAAGPVQTGSLGQSQIHAIEFRVARLG